MDWLPLLLPSPLTILVVAVLWRVSARRRWHPLRERVNAVPLPSGTRWHITVRGQGAACPVCRALYPTHAGCWGSLGDHIIHEHPTTPYAADVRYVRAVAGRLSTS